jgi:hypothetical protein
MSTRVRMPASFSVLLVLLGLGVVSNAITGALVSAGIGAALLVGLIVGNDGVRKFMQALAVLQILANAILIATSAGAGAAAYLLALWVVIGIVLPIFLIWTLSRANVREWMFRKNFNLDDMGPPNAIVHNDRAA